MAFKIVTADERLAEQAILGIRFFLTWKQEGFRSKAGRAIPSKSENGPTPETLLPLLEGQTPPCVMSKRILKLIMTLFSKILGILLSLINTRRFLSIQSRLQVASVFSGRKANRRRSQKKQDGPICAGLTDSMGRK